MTFSIIYLMVGITLPSYKIKGAFKLELIKSNVLESNYVQAFNRYIKVPYSHTYLNNIQ